MLFHSTEGLVHFMDTFTDQGMPEPLRINSLHSCAKSARLLYDAFLALPSIQVVGLPFAAYVTMSHMQAVVLWIDEDIMRSTVDLLYLLDKTIELFYRADEVYMELRHASFMSGAPVRYDE